MPWRHRDAQREDGHVRIEAETGVSSCKARNTKDCWGPPEARREAWDRFSPRSPQEGTNSPDTLTLGF